MARDAIYGAAVELFMAKGFEETTVDEIAEASGVSRRSFFRYFASKDDLLAQSVVAYGHILADAVRLAPPNLSQFELIEHTLMAGAKYAVTDPVRTRQVVAIAERSPAARQAHHSRMTQVEDLLMEAFAARSKGSRKEMRARLLAAITHAAMASAIFSWCKGEEKDLQTAVKHVLRAIENLVTK